MEHNVLLSSCVLLLIVFCVLLRRRRAPFTVHCVLQWILASRLRGSHRSRCFTIDSDRRFKIACILEWIMNVDASKLPRPPKNKDDVEVPAFFLSTGDLVKGPFEK